MSWFPQRRLLLAPVASLLLALVSCRPALPTTWDWEEPPTTLEMASTELAELSDGDVTEYEATFRSVLRTSIQTDSYHCLPHVSRVLAPPVISRNPRTLRGSTAHYGAYHGPFRYRVGVGVDETGAPIWKVWLNIAVVPTTADRLELPDCKLRKFLEGDVVCEGTPYEEAEGWEACPESGNFSAPATRLNQQTLMKQWSYEAEQLLNRDAIHYELPVRYDFEFFLSDDSENLSTPVDAKLSLSPTCGRTPYFSSFRSGWSLSIIAHEASHFLGLRDEYEPFSGVVGFYPKTPFKGAEISRMGISMKPASRMLPIHHYLVLRRLHCQAPTPGERDPYHDPAKMFESPSSR